jgi:hypothetical protein
MTGVLTVGALAAVVGPAVVGALVVPLGLPTVLVWLAVLAAAGQAAPNATLQPAH